MAVLPAYLLEIVIEAFHSFNFGAVYWLSQICDYSWVEKEPYHCNGRHHLIGYLLEAVSGNTAREEPEDETYDDYYEWKDGEKSQSQVIQSEIRIRTRKVVYKETVEWDDSNW